MNTSRLLFLLLAGVLACVADLRAQSGAVYVVDITGEVDLGLSPYVRRSFAEAEQAHAAVVVLRVNTFGGRIDVATEVRDIVLGAKVPTVAFIDRRAISAGALIALAADSIVMTPGGSIGAATPVSEKGEKASEKVVSYMRSEMRSTAEGSGRDPRIAEAMVDETLAVTDSSLEHPGDLLTLTTEEAMRVGYCDLRASSLDEALAKLGLAGRPVVHVTPSWSEHLVTFFTRPMVSSVLIMLGLGGLIFGIKTGHFGSVVTIGLGSLALFFGAQYLAELASFLEILMFLAGVVLLAIEVFVIPGFGIVGILGIVLMVTSLFLALGGSFSLITRDSLTIPLYTLAGSFVGLAILIALMIRYLPGSGAFNHLVLQTPVPAIATNRELAEVRELLGSEGRALTTLRPAGVALVRGERCDVITDGEYISAGEPVRVVRVEGRKVVVRRDAERSQTPAT
jgi:membrane-bound serine protease (ClpP class)